LKATSVRQLCLYWLPPLLFTAGILLASGEVGSSRYTLAVLQWLRTWLPFAGPVQIVEVNMYLRKAGHVAAYAALYFLWFRAFMEHLSSRLGPAVFWSLCFCLLTSLGDEGHQFFVASRSGSLRDVTLDFGAAALMALALSLKSRYLKRMDRDLSQL
jgi:VanZ family protein